MTKRRNNQNEMLPISEKTNLLKDFNGNSRGFCMPPVYVIDPKSSELFLASPLIMKITGPYDLILIINY